MKRVLFSFLALSLLIGSAYAESPVDFGDPTVKAAVEDALWVLDPTPSDMLGLLSLSIINKDLTSLSGLQYATNMLSLTIQRCNISDISPLASLINLESLDLERNDVSSINVLSGMTNLSWLSVHRNRVSDVSVLAGLTNLSWVDLRINPLNEESYDTVLSQIYASNPGVLMFYDPAFLRRLIVSAMTGGRVTDPGEGAYGYEYNTELMLMAKPKPGFEFFMWSGTFQSSMNPLYFIMDQDYLITASFQSLASTLYVDDDARGDPGPWDQDRSDPDEDGTIEHPFDRIQEALEVARDNSVILVRPGTYYETIDLLGKPVVLTGIDPNDADGVPYPIIDGGGRGPVVRSTYYGNRPCTLSGLVIRGGKGNVGALSFWRSDPTLRNCLIVGNRGIGLEQPVIKCDMSNVVFENCTIVDNDGREKGAAIVMKDSNVTIRNSIVFGNSPAEILADDPNTVSVSYSDIAGGWPGAGNIDEKPLFAQPGHWATRTEPDVAVEPDHPAAVWMAGDYHLKSQSGRWDPKTQTWQIDVVTSPGIDQGDPEVSTEGEPTPNAGIVNMGAYGGTWQASKSR